MKRRTTDDERKLFKAHIDEPRPLKAVMSKTVKRKAKASKSGGLDGNTAEKLKRGQLTPGARIDLHGMTEAVAHATLLSFLAGAQSRGVRLALVITGMGNPKHHEGAEWMRSPHGVLKQMVPRWLKEVELAGLIADVRPAHVKHGGGGALYVYLRKR